MIEENVKEESDKISLEWFTGEETTENTQVE